MLESEKKKIVICIDWYWPAFKAGGPIRSIENFVLECKNIFDISIICGSIDYGETEMIPNIQSDIWQTIHENVQIYYIHKNNYNRRTMFKILDQTEADYYYIQGIFSIVFSVFPLIWWKQTKRGQAVVAPRGMMHTTALEVKKTKKKIYLFGVKLMGWLDDVYIHATNKIEAQEIRKNFSKKLRIVEVPNFPNIICKQSEKIKQENSLKLISVSRISIEKNNELMIDALQLITDKKIEFTMIGAKGANDYFEKVNDKINQLPNNIIVHRYEFVEPKEIQKHLHENDVFITSTYGENYGHAIAEALQTGLPSIVSKNTPWNELEKNNCGINPELNKEDFCKAIEYYYYMTSNLFAMQKKNANAYFLSKSNRNVIVEKYLEIFH